MLQYLFVILDTSADSFCFYKTPTKKSELIDLQLLKDVIFFSQKENLTVNFLTGSRKLPEEYLKVMDTINHIVISREAISMNGNHIQIADYNEKTSMMQQRNESPNLILRVEKKYLPNLSKIVDSITILRRLSIVLLDMDTYIATDLDEYKIQLNKIKDSYLVNLHQNHEIELNILSDRLALIGMNNCDAGDKHITFAPNGKFYICPGFYFADGNDSVGDLATGLNIKNQQLYKLEFAPICRNCDAFQCKRCIYLNRKTTLEVNTPSHEQCVTSHLERNCTKDLLDKVQYLIPELADKEIMEIDYLDPFDKIC